MALSLKEVLDLCTRYGVIRIKASTADAGDVELDKVILPPEEKPEKAEPEEIGADGLTPSIREDLFYSRK